MNCLNAEAQGILGVFQFHSIIVIKTDISAVTLYRFCNVNISVAIYAYFEVINKKNFIITSKNGDFEVMPANATKNACVLSAVFVKNTRQV